MPSGGSITRGFGSRNSTPINVAKAPPCAAYRERNIPIAAELAKKSVPLLGPRRTEKSSLIRHQLCHFGKASFPLGDPGGIALQPANLALTHAQPTGQVAGDEGFFSNNQTHHAAACNERA